MRKNLKNSQKSKLEEFKIEFDISEKQYNTFKKLGKYTGFIFLFIGLYLIFGNIEMFSSPVVDASAGLFLVFITGLLTSVHCIGMCSGFIFAYTKEDSEIKISRKDRFKKHLVYNFSRLTSYTLFGALAGLIGASFMVAEKYRGYLSVFAGLFMLLYGLSTFFPVLRKVTTIRTPNLTKYTKGRGPMLFGLLNGLMPCGPLQAMLLYSASSGGAIQGGLTMLAFGIGTVPLMFIFGNAVSFFSHKFTRKIMSVSAIVVMALGLVTLNRGLLLSGYGLPLPSVNLFSSGENQASLKGATAQIDGDYQEIEMTVDQYGWNPDTFYVQKGVPVKWTIYVETLTYCFQGLRVPEYDLKVDFTKEGETVTLEFVPEAEGTVLFTCWMGMARGDIIVKEDLGEIEEPIVKKEPGVAVLKIRGMCCSGCATYIESLVLEIEGVNNASVSYDDRKAEINFDPQKTNIEEIINIIRSSRKYDAEEY